MFNSDLNASSYIIAVRETHLASNTNNTQTKSFKPMGTQDGIFSRLEY